MNPTAKYEALLAHLSTYESALIAYSGGVDSTLLAFSAHVILGPKCLAVLARSDTYPETEVESARAIAQMLGLRLHEVETNELVDPAFRANTPDRCYHCKTEMFGLLRTIATSRGLAYVLDGSNLDDLADHRPGTRAAAEFGVRSPLSEVGFTKDDIREVAAMLGLPNWDKPSMACLASRFPYGEEITEERLQRVAQAEEAVRALGLRQFRVRAHGDVARVEVDSREMDRAWDLRDEMASAVKLAGFTFVAADLTGYRTGSLNEALPPQE
ncbi:MAG: ATP-dependent sacrificial sulfur transferase LarE [Coriobacteriia bacterium]